MSAQLKYYGNKKKQDGQIVSERNVRKESIMARQLPRDTHGSGPDEKKIKSFVQDKSAISVTFRRYSIDICDRSKQLDFWRCVMQVLETQR